ncbi:SDR family NAD(P)-dependent oxidoreductase [Streptomyces sp. NPDC002559]
MSGKVWLITGTSRGFGRVWAQAALDRGDRVACTARDVAGLVGPVEDVTEEQARAQFETNFFGALRVTQAVRPVLREQGSRHILQMSSIAGMASWPMLGLYRASKWALECMTDALAQEVARFGIHVTLLEPGPFRTDWRGSSAV